MKNLLIRGFLGLSMLFMLAVTPSPANAQVVVRVDHRINIIIGTIAMSTIVMVIVTTDRYRS